MRPSGELGKIRYWHSNKFVSHLVNWEKTEKSSIDKGLWHSPHRVIYWDWTGSINNHRCSNVFFMSWSHSSRKVTSITLCDQLLLQEYIYIYIDLRYCHNGILSSQVYALVKRSLLLRAAHSLVVVKMPQSLKIVISQGQVLAWYIIGLAQQTRDVHPMLFQCWPTVFDVGPTLKHWVNIPCLLILSTQSAGPTLPHIWFWLEIP